MYHDRDIGKLYENSEKEYSRGKRGRQYAGQEQRHKGKREGQQREAPVRASSSSVLLERHKDSSLSLP